MSLAPGHRYRCAACGNLTRFDEEAKRHTRRFLHFTLAGELEVEEENVVSEQLIEIRCRWCGNTDRIEQVPVLDADA